MPPKPVMWAHSESPPQTPLPHSIPTQEASPEHMQNTVWKRNLVFSRETNFGHLKTSMANHHVPLECASFVGEEQIENAFDFKTLSGLQLSRHTRLLWFTAVKVFSILTCRVGLCRGPLRPGSPMALGAARTPPKPSKSSQPCETPHKHPPDNLDVGNKILHYLCGHLSPAIF